MGKSIFCANKKEDLSSDIWVWLPVPTVPALVGGMLRQEDHYNFVPTTLLKPGEL